MIRLLLILLTVLTTTTAASAQTDREQSARDDLDYYRGNDRRPATRNSGLRDNLWYGAGAQLGFQGGNSQSFFQIGLSPIVGYKVTDFLSFGPRGSVVYNSFAYDTFNGDRVRERWASWSAGLFGRVRVFQQFFAHAEYDLVSDVDLFDRGTNRRIRTTRVIPFLGGGYSQGGGPGSVGFEIMILFRLTPRDRLNDQPFEIRSGLNYNF